MDRPRQTALSLSLTSLCVVTALHALAGCHSPSPIARRDAGPRSDAAARGDAGGEPAEAPPCANEVDGSFCTAYAAVLCATQFACCDDPSTLPSSTAACETEVRDECMALRVDTCAAGELVRFDAAEEAAILDRLGSARGSCAALPYPAIDHLAALRGGLGEGDDCSPSGADWSLTFACGAGLYCHVADMWDEEGVLRAECRRYAAVGEICGPDAECAPEAHCVSADLESETGTCVRNLGAGEACATDDDCDSELCDAETARCLAEDPHDTWCGEGAE